MPRRASALSAQIKLLTAHIKADKAERRTTEAPVLAARKPLAEAVRKSTASVTHWQQKVAAELHGALFGFGGWRLNEFEGRLTDASRTLQSRLLDLRVFDAAHNIDAEYTVPVLDRDAIKRDALADRDRSMTAIRARYADTDNPHQESLT